MIKLTRSISAFELRLSQNYRVIKKRTIGGSRVILNVEDGPKEKTF